MEVFPLVIRETDIVLQWEDTQGMQVSIYGIFIYNLTMRTVVYFCLFVFSDLVQ